MLLKQKVVLISREVIERARQRDEQTEVLTEVRTRFQGPQYVLPLTMALLTSYTVNESITDTRILSVNFQVCPIKCSYMVELG